MNLISRDLHTALKFLYPPGVRAAKHKRVLIERTSQGLRLAVDWISEHSLWLETLVPGPPGNAAIVVGLDHLSDLIVGDDTPLNVNIDPDGLRIFTTSRHPDCRRSQPPLQVALEDGSGGAIIAEIPSSSPQTPRTLVSLFPQECDGMMADLPRCTDEVSFDLQALAEVASACSKDRARPVLGKVQVKRGCMIATDAFRLYMRLTRSKLPCPDLYISAAAIPTILTLSSPIKRYRDFGPYKLLTFTDKLHTIGVDLKAEQFPEVVKFIPEERGEEFFRLGLGAEKVLKSFIRNAKNCQAVFTSGSKGHLAIRAQHELDGQPNNWTVELEGEMSIDQVAFNPYFLIDVFVGTNSRELTKHPDETWWSLQERATGGKRIRVLMPVRIR